MPLYEYVDRGFPVHGHPQILFDMVSRHGVDFPHASVVKVAEKAHQILDICLMLYRTPALYLFKGAHVLDPDASPRFGVPSLLRILLHPRENVFDLIDVMAVVIVDPVRFIRDPH